MSASKNSSAKDVVQAIYDELHAKLEKKCKQKGLREYVKENVDKLHNDARRICTVNYHKKRKFCDGVAKEVVVGLAEW